MTFLCLYVLLVRAAGTYVPLSLSGGTLYLLFAPYVPFALPAGTLYLLFALYVPFAFSIGTFLLSFPHMSHLLYLAELYIYFFSICPVHAIKIYELFYHNITFILLSVFLL